MLETRCIVDTLDMLVTALTTLVISIYQTYHQNLNSSTSLQNVSPTPRCRLFSALTQLKTFFTHFYGRFEYRQTWKNLCDYYETSDEISNNDNWIFTIWRLHNAGQGSPSNVYNIVLTMQ